MRKVQRQTITFHNGSRVKTLPYSLHRLRGETCDLIYSEGRSIQHTTTNIFKEIERVISVSEIKDPAEWLLIFIKTLREGMYDTVEILGFRKGPTEKRFQQIGSEVVNVQRK